MACLRETRIGTRRKLENTNQARRYFKSDICYSYAHNMYNVHRAY